MAATNVLYGVDWETERLAIGGVDLEEYMGRFNVDSYDIDRFTSEVFEDIEQVIKEEVEYETETLKEENKEMNKVLADIKEFLESNETISEADKKAILRLY